MRLSLAQGAEAVWWGWGDCSSVDCGWLVPKPEGTGMDLGATVARDPTKGLRPTLPAQEPWPSGTRRAGCPCLGPCTDENYGIIANHGLCL